MTSQDHTVAGPPVEVVLRFAGEDGVVDMTRDATGGIGEPAHRLAFATWVVSLGDTQYRLEDPWVGGGWLWIFLPPETDYDPSNDFDEVIKAIPQEEILSDYQEWRKTLSGSREEPSGSTDDSQ